MKKSSVLIPLFFAIVSGCVKEIRTPDPGAVDYGIVSNASNRPSPPPSILQWQKTLGSTANEIGYGIITTSDGGYILAGNTLGNNGDVSGNHGGSDAWIVKLNSSGSIDWQKCFGGTKGDYAYAITATTDGGYAFAGMTQSNDGDVSGFHGGQDVWIVKLDASGTLLWQKSLGGFANELPNSIIQTTDNGFLVAAYTFSNDGDIAGTNHGGQDAWIIKLNSDGSTVWQKTYGGTAGESAGSILPAAGGNFMVSASTQSNNGDLSGQINHGGTDTWLFRIDGNGSIGWQKTYGGAGDEGSGGIYETSDGYIFSTSTTSNNQDVSGNHGFRDAWVVSIKTDGSIKWKKCYGGTDADDCNIKVFNSATGEMILVGNTFSKNGDISGLEGSEDFWTLKLDSNGNILNSNVLGGKSADTGSDAVVSADGLYYMAVGRTESKDGDVSGNHGLSDMWVVKFKF